MVSVFIHHPVGKRSPGFGPLKPAGSHHFRQRPIGAGLTHVAAVLPQGRRVATVVKPGGQTMAGSMNGDILLRALRFGSSNLAPGQWIARGWSEDRAALAVGLVDYNEYTRRQAPGGIKVTPWASGRDRRRPISGRFF